jgi:hypothetical protein
MEVNGQLHAPATLPHVKRNNLNLKIILNHCLKMELNNFSLIADESAIARSSRGREYYDNRVVRVCADHPYSGPQLPKV